MALVDPRQQQITTFFNKSAEETGKLESEDRLNLESDNAGQTSAAAGVVFHKSVQVERVSEESAEITTKICNRINIHEYCRFA